jgi:hypothetical protein
MILGIAMRMLKMQMNREAESMVIRMKRKIMMLINVEIRLLCKIMRITR